MAIETLQVNQATTSGAEIAVDIVGSASYQVFKLGLGADGAFDLVVDSGQQVMAASVPIVIASDQTNVAVSAAALPLPAGAATAARQDTVIAHTSAAESLLTTIDSDTSTLAAAVSGGLVKVSIDQDSVGIGGGIQYTEGLLAPASATGNVILAVRDDALSALPIVEGNLSKLRMDANGALWTRVNGTVNTTVTGTMEVTSSGAFTVQEDGLALTALQVISAAVSASALEVFAGSLPLPAGAATAARQDTVITHVSASESLLTTINSNIATIEAAVSASAMEVFGTLVTSPASASVTHDIGAGNAGTETIRITIASDQVNVAVSAAALPLPTGAATENSMATVAGAVSANVMFVQPAASNAPLYAPVDVSASGGVSVISTVSGRQIRVISCIVVASVTANIYFASSSAAGSLTGEMEVRPATGFHLGYNPMGHFQTVLNQPLLLVSDQNGQMGGVITYITV